MSGKKDNETNTEVSEKAVEKQEARKAVKLEARATENENEVTAQVGHTERTKTDQDRLHILPTDETANKTFSKRGHTMLSSANTIGTLVTEAGEIITKVVPVVASFATRIRDEIGDLFSPKPPLAEEEVRRYLGILKRGVQRTIGHGK